jgi:mono/diheme cytochrome c family protein
MRGRAWRLPAVVAVLVPLVLLGWTLTAVFAQGEPSPGASPSGLPGDPQKGAQVFGSQGCAGCHGANLEGGIGAKLNPIQQLPGVDNPLDPTYLEKTIRQGRSGDPGFSTAMPSFGPDTLSDQALADVVSYIIDSNKKGAAGLGPVELARSNVLWVTIGVVAMVLVVYLLARYNMRWVERRAAARRESGRVR